MSEQVAGQPAPRNPLARLAGVISSPKATFEEIARNPSWIFPVICYLVVSFLALGLFAVKADWNAVDAARLEYTGLTKIMPPDRLEEGIKRQNARLERMTPFEVAVSKTVENGGGALFGFHGTALIYSTLFVVMGALSKMKLGRAWLKFLLCAAIYCGYLVVAGVAGYAFANAPEAALLLTSTSLVVMLGGWMWVLNQAAGQDEDLHRMISITAHASVILILSYLVMGAISLASQETLQVPPENLVKSSLGAYVDSGIPVLQKVLNSLDLFILWWLGVMMIGFRVATKLSAGVTASITFLPWAVIVLIKVAWTAVFG